MTEEETKENFNNIDNYQLEGDIPCYKKKGFYNYFNYNINNNNSLTITCFVFFCA